MVGSIWCRGPGAPAGGRGRTETPPAKLSACATCHAHGKIRLRGAPGGVAMRGLASRAHAESFACRGSVRGTVRGRAAHPARCHDRAAITPAHYPGGAMGTSRPTAIMHARGARNICTRNICPRGAPAHDRGALRAAITPAKFVRHAARGGGRGLQEKKGNDRMENDSR